MQTASESPQSIADLFVIIHPELAAASLRDSEAELYALWCVLKSIDTAKGGSGKITCEWLMLFIKGILGVSQSQAYVKFNKGVGLYWNKPGKRDGEKVTSLIGRKTIVERLSPTMTRSEPFRFKISNLEANEELNCGDLRALMVAVVAGRYVDHRPVSIDSIAQQTGLSERTIQRYLRKCPDLKSVKNFELISTHLTEKDAARAMSKISKKTSAVYSISAHLDKFLLLKQLPNTYILTTPARLPLRKRPSELRDRDVVNSSGIQKKRYYKQSSKKPVTHPHLTMGEMTILPCGAAGIWSGQCVEVVKAPMRSRIGVWQSAKKEAVRKRRKSNNNKSINNVST